MKPSGQMTLTLTTELEKFVRDEVKRGAFASSSEYVRDLVRERYLKERDRAARLEALDAALARGIADADAGRSSISAYGLKSKQRIYSHEFTPEPDHQIAIGDLALTPAGDVLAMDAQGGKVYRVTADRRALDGLNRPFLSPQDAAISEDGHAAYIADYQRGIARVDLRTGDHEWLLADRTIALSGIDGLYSYRGGLIAVQNGVQPERVAYCRLGGDGHRITHCETLERGEPLGEPTHGVVIGDTFVYIANSGWDKLDEHGRPRAGETLKAPELRKLALPH